MRIILLLAAVFLIPSFAVAKDKQKAPIEPVMANVEFWLPPDFQSGKGPWPLIIFSHGFGGCAKQSTFLTAYLAEQGYIVAAPDHIDARPCKTVRAYEMHKDMLERQPEKPFRQPEQWDDQTYASRRDDINNTLSSILADPLFKGYVDEDHIGLMGHSLGGYTALGIAGGWPAWKDPRFKAVMLLAPYTGPYVVEKTLSGVDLPAIYLTGSRDYDITALIKKSGTGAYAQTSAPKYMMELNEAGHFSFTERDNRFHERINKTALAFFDAYLKGGDAMAINPGRRNKDISAYWEELRNMGKASD